MTCTLCHFTVELDDVVLRHGERACVCLRCFDRETDGARVMPKALRRDLEQTLAVCS